jgi:23S rRNA (uracil1939-C5)-methyltransferase
MPDPLPERLRPERFVAGGEALARDADGRVVFVREAVPGDDVMVSVIEDQGDWWRGAVVEVVEAAESRVRPPCVRRREGCGGCDWQHVAVGAQLGAKAEIVEDALRRTGRLPDARLRLGAAIGDRAYRTTIRVVGDERGRPAFRRERSHDTVPATGCLIAHPALEAALADLELTPGLELTLRVSAATGEMTARWSPGRGQVAGLPPHAATGPDAALEEVVAGHRFRVSASSFFQSGPEAAELLVDAVRRAAPELADSDLVVDAYAGVGLFAVAATGPGAKVIAVESSRSAVADCRVNFAGREGRVEQGQVGRWRPARDERVDVVVADPARSGLGRPGVAAIARSEPGVVVLVSCDPVALARDAELLGRHGFEHRMTEVHDLFPHTHHVECVTRFVRV